MKAIWHKREWQSVLLLPLSCLYRFLTFFRASLYKLGILKINTFDAPVIVVGNISVGGTGKTPIVIALVKHLQQAGYIPGVVSRGYGAEPAKEPRHVDAQTPSYLAGDEPALIAQQTNAAVCICTNRSLAVSALLKEHQVNVVISDDGMQHYAMHRDVEIAVVDGQRLLGNGWLLPAGPLREPLNRLLSTDFIALQHSPEISDIARRSRFLALKLPHTVAPAAGHFHLAVTGVRGLADQRQLDLSYFNGATVHAVAGVGNPDRFFKTLRDAGLNVIEHAMPDHHRYTAADLSFDDEFAILITAKDAVKIRELNIEVADIFEVSAQPQLDAALKAYFDQLLKSTRNSTDIKF